MSATLFKTIKTIGDQAAAKRWGVTPRAILAWRLGERSPAIQTGLEIARLEGWSLDQVYEDLPIFVKPPRPAGGGARSSSGKTPAAGAVTTHTSTVTPP